MWEGKPKALTIEISEVVGECLSDELLDLVDDDVDVDIDDKVVKLQMNVNPDGSWKIVGVNGYPIDTTKRLVDV